MGPLVLGAGHLGNEVSYSLPVTCLLSRNGQGSGQGDVVAALADKEEEVSYRPPKMEAQRSPLASSDPAPPPEQGVMTTSTVSDPRLQWVQPS